MKIIDKMCEKVGLIDPEEKDDELIEEQEEETPAPKEQPKNVVNFSEMASSSSRDNVIASYKMKVIVIEPKSFDDAQQVANCLREKRPVVINFENTETEAAKRIIDFISGTTYALNGEIKKVGKNVFLCAPSNVNVSYTEENKHMISDMPWLKK